MAAVAPRPPRMPGVAPRWHLGGTTRAGRWPRSAHRAPTFAPAARGGGTVPAHHGRASLAHYRPRSKHMATSTSTRRRFVQVAPTERTSPVYREGRVTGVIGELTPDWK